MSELVKLTPKVMAYTLEGFYKTVIEASDSLLLLKNSRDAKDYLQMLDMYSRKIDAGLNQPNN
jgi:hypothetical protein